jgi:recombination protein RecT
MNTRNPTQQPTESASMSTALSTRQFSETANKFESQFGKLIPDTLKANQIITSKRIVALLVHQWATDEKIRLCKPSSILNAAGIACSVGLEFNNPLGQSAIIPYDNRRQVDGQWKTVKEAQWQLMYRGGITLALRSGKVAHVSAEVVTKHDEFDYHYGTNAKLVHIPAKRFGREDFDFEADWWCAYCLIDFKDGSNAHFRVMDRLQIEEIRDKAAKGTDKDSSPWNRYLEEMIRKTVVKSELKYLDLTPQASWPRDWTTKQKRA